MKLPTQKPTKSKTGENIHEIERREKQEAKAMIGSGLSQDAEKIKNGYKWVKHEVKGMVLRKVN